MDVSDHIVAWKRAAYERGAEDARATASWITDGNDTDESRRRKLERIDEYGPDDILNRPNLSGEWADDSTPRSLFEEITGLDAHANASFNPDAYNGVCDELCRSYEDGVDDTFTDACITELRKWLAD